MRRLWLPHDLGVVVLPLHPGCAVQTLPLQLSVVDQLLGKPPGTVPTLPFSVGRGFGGFVGLYSSSPWPPSARLFLR